MVTSGLRLSPRVCVVNLIYHQAVPFTSHWYVKKCAINHTLIVQTWAQYVPSLFMLKLKTYLANSCRQTRRVILSSIRGQGFLITPRKRSLGQGNIFTPVCHSVHRGCVCVSQHAPGSHYIRSCTGADTQLVWRQHTGNIECMMG